MAKRKKTNDPTEVDSIKHGDKRRNIPTEELRDFVADDERDPKTMLYPRDPSLDPQLVWKGKDQQDAQDLEVPIVPVYIQEKIHPQAIVEDIKRNGRQEGTDDQPALFDDFNGIEFEDLIDFLRARGQLVKPHDPRGFPSGHDLPRREGGPQGPGPDDLHRPALRHQVRFQLAGFYA
jgi:hypothetical protein